MTRLRILGITLLLAACSPALPASPTTTVTAPPAASPTSPVPTNTGTETAALHPTITPTIAPTIVPTITPLRPPTVTFEAGLIAVEHPKFFGFVFLIDPAVWTVETVDEGEYQETLKFLRHNTIPDCQLKAPMAAGIPTPDRLYRRTIGEHSFIVMDFMNASLYETDNQSLRGSQFFDLYGTANPDCRAALETVLGKMMEAPVFYGDMTAVPVVTSTPRPPLEFNCNSRTPLLRVDDVAYVVADGIWLRSEPRHSEDTQSRLLPKYAPYYIFIDGGPACDDDYVFWHVTAAELGEGGTETIAGWMAEANGNEYFLENLNP
jgi:hypothetical protein